METLTTQALTILITSVFLTTMFIKWFSKYSKSIGLVDQPNERKIHQGAIPLVGGISIFSALSFVVLTSDILFATVVRYLPSILATLLILTMAVYDDRFDLSAKLRLVIQLIAAFLVAKSGVRIESMHGLFGWYEIPLNFQYMITVFVLVGSTNAFNLIDGVDGLAGSLGLISSLFLATLSWVLGQEGLVLLCLGLASAIAVFLKYNFFPAKIFMGDAGSMTLGFLLTVISIILLQVSLSTVFSTTTFVIICCVLMVPVVDALRVFMKRYASGISPLKADKSHLHHIVLSRGNNSKQVVYSIAGLQLTLIVFGIVLTSLTNITVVMLTLAITQIVISKVLRIDNTLVEWQEQLRQNERLYLQ